MVYAGLCSRSKHLRSGWLVHGRRTKRFRGIGGHVMLLLGALRNEIGEVDAMQSARVVRIRYAHWPLIVILMSDLYATLFMPPYASNCDDDSELDVFP